MQMNIDDQHLSVRFPVSSDRTTLVVHFKNDFGLALANELPPLGSASRSLRVVSESWNDSRDQLTLNLSGVAGKQYELSVWNPSQVATVNGGVLTKAGKLQVQMPGGPEGTYVHQKVVLHFEKR